MRPRSPFSLGRRSAAVAVATAVIAAPFLAAAPASADASVLTSAAFPVATLSGGEYTQAYFNADPALTEVDGFEACFAEYKNGTVLRSGGAQVASAPVQYDYITTQGYAPGDTYAVSFFDSDPTADYCTVAPDLATPGLVSASILLGAPTPAPVPGPAGQDFALTATDVKLTRGVAIDQLLVFTTAGMDFSAKGGEIGYGAQSGNEPEAGYVDPLEGLTVTVLHEWEPGVTPQIHITGTPKYSGTTRSGFQIVDGTNSGSAEFSFVVADKSGVVTPITIDLAAGGTVAGAKVAIVTSGLKEGAAWSATVRSTPVVVGSGTIAFGGNLAAQVVIPAGLEAGSHSITVTSTNADGTPFSSVLYFTVSASGTLLAVSNTAPALLAATGVDLMVPSLIAAGLLVAGLALAGTSVYRRRNN